MKHSAIIVLLSLILVGCSVLKPIFTPLADLDLSGQLVQEGDLPAGFTGAQVGDTMPVMFSVFPDADKKLYQQFAYQGGQGRGVALFVYLSKDKLDAAYKNVLDAFGSNGRNIDGVGEKAAILIFYSDIPPYVSFESIAFYDCNFIVFARFGIVDEGSAVTYANRLDERLKPILCPYSGI